MPVIETIERTTIRYQAVPIDTIADPFNIDHDCRNPTGHDFIASCGDVVCIHCSRVVWR